MELPIPARVARAFEVERGREFSVVASEGKQVGDLTVLARDDHAVGFSSQVTASANGRSLRRARTLYAGPPGFAALLEVVDDPVGTHWIHGRCTRLRTGAGEPNCHDNIVDSLKPFGVPEASVPYGTFNVFMAVDVDADGTYQSREPEVEPGQSITFRACTDVLVSVSACPSTSVTNAFEPKGLTIAFR